MFLNLGDKLLYEDLNFSLPPAGIVGIIGPNGAGKTTFSYDYAKKILIREVLIRERQLKFLCRPATYRYSPEKTI